jgi:hypothetical protein
MWNVAAAPTPAGGESCDRHYRKHNDVDDWRERRQDGGGAIDADEDDGVSNGQLACDAEQW